jgi:hypothetical protein
MTLTTEQQSRSERRRSALKRAIALLEDSDSPEQVADDRKVAERQLAEMKQRPDAEYALTNLDRSLGHIAVQKALAPLKLDPRYTSPAEIAAARVVALRNLDRLRVDLMMHSVKSLRERAYTEEPTVAETRAALQQYDNQLSTMAAAGALTPPVLARIQRLLVEREQAEAMGDSTRSIDRSLANLGAPHPFAGEDQPATAAEAPARRPGRRK